MTAPFITGGTETAQQPAPSLTITTGDVRADDTGSLIKEEPDGSAWTDYRVFNHYEHDFHRYLLGLTSPNGFQGASCAFVQLAAPTLLWLADWTACRFGVPPEIPDPQLTVGNWVLLDVHQELPGIISSPDAATPLYRISGTYVYGHKAPDADVWKDPVFPRTPWLEDAFPRDVPAAALAQGLLDSSSTGSAAAIVSPGMNARVI